MTDLIVPGRDPGDPRELYRPTEYTEPGDLRNMGLVCSFCGDKHPVYEITVGPFPQGAYCYKCLLGSCRAYRGIPMPMETEMLDRLQVDLGIMKSTQSRY